MISGNSIIKYTSLFLLYFSCMQYVNFLIEDSAFSGTLLQLFTVKPGEFLINLLMPETSVHAQHASLLSNRGNLVILPGCEGTEAVYLLSAAFLASWIKWKDKMIGIVLGIVLVYALNLARITWLFYVFAYHRRWFDFSHAYLGSTFIIVFSCLFFVLWLQRDLACEKGRLDTA